jgi:hypothetical protein
MPEILFDSLDAVPEGLREGAVEADGKVKINVVAKAKLDEFRENNVKLAKERDELATFAGRAKTILGSDDMDAVEKDLVAVRIVAQRVKDGELVENKGLETAVEERTKQMRETYESEAQKQVKEAAGWRDKFAATSQRLRQTFVDRAISDAVFDESSGVEPRALTDILQRAYRVFEVSEDGKLTAKIGDAIMYGNDPGASMSPKEWVATLKDEAPYFFKVSVGGGAGGSGEAKKLGGFTQEQLSKMTPIQRLRLANGEKMVG